MAGCDYSVLLDPYHDNELSPIERADVERHLADCAACGADLAKIRLLSGVLRQIELPRATPALVNRLESGFTLHPQITLFSFVKRMTAVAAGVFLASMCYSMVNQRTAGPRMTAGLAPWEQQVISPDTSESGSAEPQFMSLVVQGLSGGRP